MTTPLELALRIEWKGKGPFWCQQTARLLQRLCRQATPEWKKQAEDCSCFLEHYVATAPSPYDNPTFDWHLSRLRDGDTALLFGFLSVRVLATQFGLSRPVYRQQFETLLQRPEFAVRAYLVRPLARSDEEVLFRSRDAELVEEARCWDDLQRL